jgi:hypothetical protein
MNQAVLNGRIHLIIFHTHFLLIKVPLVSVYQFAILSVPSNPCFILQKKLGCGCKPDYYIFLFLLHCSLIVCKYDF